MTRSAALIKLAREHKAIVLELFVNCVTDTEILIVSPVTSAHRRHYNDYPRQLSEIHFGVQAIAGLVKYTTT